MAYYRVISIGTLAAHPLWGETREVRTGHATTVLITAGKANIIVNPSLPATVLEARLSERTRIEPDAITHVFLTSFSEEHDRGLPLFDEAVWLLHEPEHEAAREVLEGQLERAEESGDPNVIDRIQGRISMLHRCRPAEDQIAEGVDLFPLPGYSPGCCGLLLPQPQVTVLVCGDAIPTLEHLEEGKVLPQCSNLEQAQESFREAVEIADVLVPGRDNVILNPLRRVM